MPSLVINAPKKQVVENKKQSFDTTLKTGIGDGYAIDRKTFALIHPGCKVILLSKDEKRRAEGRLVKLVPTSLTLTGMQRYNVYIRDLVEIKYRSEKLLHTGVALLP